MVRNSTPTPNPGERNDRTRDSSMSPEQARKVRRSLTVANVDMTDTRTTRDIVARADADFARIFGSGE